MQREKMKGREDEGTRKKKKGRGRRCEKKKNERTKKILK